MCTTDVLPQVTSAFLKGQKLGEALATRTTTRQDVGVLAPVEVTSDFHVDFAFQPDPGQFPFNPALAFPPALLGIAAYAYWGPDKVSPASEVLPRVFRDMTPGWVVLLGLAAILGAVTSSFSSSILSAGSMIGCR